MLPAPAASDTRVLRGSFSEDGTRVFTVTFQSAHAGPRIWDAATGKLIARIDTGYPVYAASISSDGRYLVTGGHGLSGLGKATIWRADTGQMVAELKGHRGDVYSVGFSRDGERVVTASEDRTAKVWDARTGKLLVSLDRHTGVVNGVAFSADGSRVVTTSEDHTAKLWDPRTGKLVASFDGHTDGVIGAAFSRDPAGARVVTRSGDHTVKLWDAQTGKLLGSLAGRADILESGFITDGTHVVSASKDGIIWRWDVQLETRTPEAIQRILSVRDPWTLSNGGLVSTEFTPESAARE